MCQWGSSSYSYSTNSSIITWYVCVRNLLSLAVSPDIETPHSPPRLSPKQQPMNKLINFTGRLALWFQNKGQKTEAGSLKQCDLYHKLGSDIWLCSATAAIPLLTMILVMLCNLSTFTHSKTRLFHWMYAGLFTVCHLNYKVNHIDLVFIFLQQLLQRDRRAEVRMALHNVSLMRRITQDE